jgi:mannose-6-phosphate isomerase-like protein (cupin superfamily)
MRAYQVVRDAHSLLTPFRSVAGSEGLSIATLISGDDGSAHVEIGLCELAPGGHVAGHLHPFEESFYILSGAALLAIDGARHALVTDDFGFVPVATPHAWSNPYDEPVRWYRIRSPQPRPIGRSNGTFPLSGYELPTDGRPVSELHPMSRFVGHFSDSDLNVPGPLTMPGAHGHNITDISVRMMVDDVLGAIHHQFFMVQFAPREDDRLSGASHFHDFEEAYFVVQGAGVVVLEGERFDIETGDLVWEGSGTMHGWTARGSEPLRFIELMAPRPPFSNMLFSEQTWTQLADETIPDGSGA